MRKTLLTLAGLALGLFQATAQGVTADKDTTGNDSTASACTAKGTTPENCSRLTAIPDSAEYRLMTSSYDRHAVTMPKYDAFSEKMKNDDWLGGLLKDIMFR